MFPFNLLICYFLKLMSVSVSDRTILLLISYGKCYNSNNNLLDILNCFCISVCGCECVCVCFRIFFFSFLFYVVLLFIFVIAVLSFDSCLLISSFTTHSVLLYSNNYALWSVWALAWQVIKFEKREIIKWCCWVADQLVCVYTLQKKNLGNNMTASVHLLQVSIS